MRILYFHDVTDWVEISDPVALLVSSRYRGLKRSPNLLCKCSLRVLRTSRIGRRLLIWTIISIAQYCALFSLRETDERVFPESAIGEVGGDWEPTADSPTRQLLPTAQHQVSEPEPDNRWYSWQGVKTQTGLIQWVMISPWVTSPATFSWSIYEASGGFHNFPNFDREIPCKAKSTVWNRKGVTDHLSNINDHSFTWIKASQPSECLVKT